MTNDKLHERLNAGNEARTRSGLLRAIVQFEKNGLLHHINHIPLELDPILKPLKSAR